MPWDPFEELREFEKRMNRLFREFFERGMTALPGGRSDLIPYRRGLGMELGIREPYTDIQETDKEIILTAEMPGIKKSDIKINTTEDSIEISAETRREEKEEKKGFVRRERGYSGYYRRYTLPSKVDPDKARATYNNGVLEIRLPKTEIKKGRNIKVE